jgi:hypothetical protein
MDDQISIRQPNRAAQCAVCFSSEFATFDKVCHCCGQPICQLHEATRPPYDQELPSLEFSGLDLRGVSEPRAIYCGSCVKKMAGVRQGWRFIAGKWHTQGAKLLLLPSQRPPVPVAPAIQRVALKEELSGTFTLSDQGEFKAEPVQSVKGALELVLHFADHDRQRLAAYCRKYFVRNRTKLPLHAGFVQCKEMATITFDDVTPAQMPQPGVLALRSQVEAHSFFTSKEPRPENEWKYTFPYTVKRPDDDPIPLPVQLVPNLVEDHGQLALELDLQLRPDITKYLDFETARIECFTLCIGAEAGPWLTAQPAPSKDTPATPGTTSSGTVITWEHIGSLTKEQPVRAFHLRFAQIQDVPKITGELKIVFTGLLSGAQEVRFYQAWGQARTAPAVQRSTEVTISFDLSLNSLTTYPLCKLPEQVVPYSPVVLNADLIADLTTRLSAYGLYLHRIVENPSQPSRHYPQEGHQFWDIAGRHYEGIHPLDFHLVLTGQSGTSSILQNELCVTYLVQGIVIDGTTEALLKELRQRLCEAVEQACEAQLKQEHQKLKEKEQRLRTLLYPGMKTS